MQDVRARKLWRSGIIAASFAAGCVVVGSFALASGSGTASGSDDPKDDDVHKKKDVRVIVSGNGEQNVWVSGDDNDGDDGDDRAGAYLGVSTEEDTKSADGGARVDSVAEDSPADKAGLHRGDTIVSFGGAAIHGPARLSEKIHSAKPGEKVEIKVRRKEGKTETLSVEMGERPQMHGYWYGNSSDSTPMPELKELDRLGDLGKQLRILKAPRAHWFFGGDRPRLGVELVETTAELREFLGGTKEAGVLIGKVLANTPAQRSGLKVGDLIVAVDGKRIADSGELIEAMDDKEGKSIDLEVVRDHRTTRVQVAIPKQEEADDEQTGPRAMRIRAMQDELRAHLARAEVAAQWAPGQRVDREAILRAQQEALAALQLAADRRRMELKASRARLSL